ncbi:cAMP-binding domain of CRP or a regulatory subunit of cAMP-dependent protein kinases [Kaistia soli DSM 19436]|uniref:cAMP-binding domain of CRP or a regulatory subunit of cAMP-dependent protein kinases n=1 Tax=Kaistia soli DSM 19436 TaxID=1122133 RepID=A0A1M5FP66_9HYPH|nr:Crp/Fnr family transcriptional regulator [Kaistia soli]SHF92951.1 cAMP-binding domain of CRP or a regulatory subunit of cAMP-dependent protein kinases [Kaistia soli DSM 19436]
MATAHRPKDRRANNLLRALRPADLALLEPHLVEQTLPSGTVLYEPGDNVQKVYFPCDSTLLSFRIQLDDGRAVETALVGREGAVAGIVSQGHLPAYSRAEVQFGGPILWMNIEDLEEAKMKSPVLHHFFARYADCLMAQVFQSVACNAAHSIEQRAAKWLISAMERTNDTSLPMTQEQLAGMLGVGRSYVSRVIQTLKHRGMIETQRGRLTVSNPAGLGHLACSCQMAVRRHFDEVLRGVYPDDPIVDSNRRTHANGTG